MLSALTRFLRFKSYAWSAAISVLLLDHAAPQPCLFMPHAGAMQALSNAHTFLYEERELLLELQAENETLHLHIQAVSSKGHPQQAAHTAANNTFRPMVPGTSVYL